MRTTQKPTNYFVEIAIRLFDWQFDVWFVAYCDQTAEDRIAADRF